MILQKCSLVVKVVIQEICGPLYARHCAKSALSNLVLTFFWIEKRCPSKVTSGMEHREENLILTTILTSFVIKLSSVSEFIESNKLTSYVT